ncbi:hypothetical protein BDB00DRAFT_908786 [Zychaea mexicana]|uniref:uncharacterized protein n=1 Tax=Zychaea mexicana TaxID=64656 RepID=UPI0022FE4BA6|nr:uncharacterized protein BDB00DRAFT_908786 [Zychaea mexicana]KAI9492975.1 hypothetical protein BDB00DRAFT_908786 [Zychaea mexicana]
MVPDIKYLGFIVTNGGVQSDPEHVEAIVVYPRPVNTKKSTAIIRNELFLSPVLRKSSPLAGTSMIYKLLQKSEEWQWHTKKKQPFKISNTTH